VAWRLSEMWPFCAIFGKNLIPTQMLWWAKFSYFQLYCFISLFCLNALVISLSSCFGASLSEPNVPEVLALHSFVYRLIFKFLTLRNLKYYKTFFWYSRTFMGFGLGSLRLWAIALTDCFVHWAIGALIHDGVTCRVLKNFVGPGGAIIGRILLPTFRLIRSTYPSGQSVKVV
jgi:hypothetical protein